ncbi:hypothetical protein [Leptothoe kymatousa]|uniref:Uncharacterized protein n=1 Tax=Leptothoe kymatousa TAU-MAC 1615 TaxID=2364775 RepID=A0ABS5Y2T4_9CYAN|nr:hypothetical protein [Leptothoe kymatousa]MBT9312158.1 hypothetical protein [Leptothoe kymatousa TAU-MAC 1615]
MNEERYRIRMRQLPGSPPDLLDKLRESIEELFDCGLTGATNYVQGRGEQESAKAAEIKAKALAQLGSLQLERQKLIDERDKAIAEHQQAMYELRTQRLKEVVDSLVRLKEMGVEVKLEVVAQVLMQAASE